MIINNIIEITGHFVVKITTFLQINDTFFSI